MVLYKSTTSIFTYPEIIIYIERFRVTNTGRYSACDQGCNQKSLRERGKQKNVFFSNFVEGVFNHIFLFSWVIHNQRELNDRDGQPVYTWASTKCPRSLVHFYIDLLYRNG